MVFLFAFIRKMVLSAHHLPYRLSAALLESLDRNCRKECRGVQRKTAERSLAPVSVLASIDTLYATPEPGGDFAFEEKSWQNWAGSATLP
jgi:hypothetical protein